MKKLVSKIVLVLLPVIFSCTQPTSNPSPNPTLISHSPIATVTPTTTSTPTPVPTVIPTITPVQIIKPTIEPTPVPTPTITPTPSPTPLVKTYNVLFDTSKNPLGTNEINNIGILSKLKSYMVAAKYNVMFDNFNNLSTLENIDTIMIFSPAKDYSNDEINKLVNFVKSGKKLIITGEWGGYSQFTTTSLNMLLKQANLEINEDVIKEYDSTNYDLSEEQLLIRSFLSDTTTVGINKLSLYSSASVDVIDGKINSLDRLKTKIVAFTGTNSYKISAITSSIGIAAISNIGSGKIAVIGDTSAFTDNDTNKNSIANIDEGDNKKFILNILNW